MEPIFTKKPEEYTRNISIIEACRQDSVFYLQRTTGQPYEVCNAYVQSTTQFNGTFGVIDRELLCLTKKTPGNRKKEVITFTDYLDDVTTNKRIVSPTFAVYMNKQQQPSTISEFIEGNITNRAIAKKEMFLAESNGDNLLAAFKDLQQTSLKLNNNAMSGAHVSSSTILYNKSAHSTLTSTCRSATSYGNANNEKFIAGNRHYYNVEVVLANIVSISRLTDMQALKAVMIKYNLHKPTVQDVMDCVHYSTQFYWRDAAGMEQIHQLVAGLSVLERSAFLYVSDLHHLAKHNPEVVRQFLGDLSYKAHGPIENPDGAVNGMDGDMKAFVSLLCAKDLKGHSIKQVRDGGEIKGVKFDPEPADYMTIAATAKNVMDTLEKYRDLIKALWVTDNMPGSIANIPNIMRRTAVVSDTDSTIFTVQEWTNWYVGKDDFSDTSLAIAWTVIYLASQLITHVLAKMSANLGIPVEYIHRIAMKNEYAFPVLSLTGRAKHYWAYVSAREGNVYHELEVELKGVALRNANVPPVIMKKMKALICQVMDAIMDRGNITVKEVLKTVVDVEWSIKNSVLNGGYEYMTRAQVKDAASYSAGEKAPNFAHYGMWNEVFAPKYGAVENPPYSAVKVSLDIRNKTELADWLSRIQDKDVAQRMGIWCGKNNKTNFTMVLLPESIMANRGIPPEIIEGVNIRKLIFSTMESYYLILESLGLFITKPDAGKAITRLLSDYYHPDDFADTKPVELLTHPKAA